VDRTEQLERENARLRAENGVLRERLQRRGLSFVPWWTRFGRWLVGLPKFVQRRRLAKRFASFDSETEARHNEELRRHLAGADDL
jgi:hypothetical protein